MSMNPILFETENNLFPVATRSSLMRTHDFKTLRYALTQASNTVRGTVILLHGRGEYIEKYFETIGDLVQRGFMVATFDWRGQGGSSRLTDDGMRGHVDSFDDYGADLNQFFGAIIKPECPPPYYILAHSMGALISLLVAPQMAGRIDRMVLIAPLLGLSGIPSDITHLATSVLDMAGFGTCYATYEFCPLKARKFNGNSLTSDVIRYTRNANITRCYPQLVLGRPTIRWVRAALSALKQIKAPGFFAGVNLPTLILAAGADRIVSTPEIQYFAKKFDMGVLMIIKEARHEILQEADLYRKQLFAAFDRFILEREERENPTD